MRYNNCDEPLLILPYYIEWHYSRALVQGVGIIEKLLLVFLAFLIQ
jgi:hypothetical protein